MTLGLATPVALMEAMWAKGHVHLAAEPDGERHGVAVPEGRSAGKVESVAAQRGEAVSLCAIGDSMVAGCGVSNQRDGLVPSIASEIASRSGRRICWQAHGRLGATMRRVRYRLVPDVDSRFDMVVLCAGSNDIMANRSLDEWREDLEAALDEAHRLSACVLVFSPGQMQYVPSLGKALRRALLREMDEQAAVSQQVCAAHGALYVNMIHENVHAGEPGFFSDDGFHPSARGYRYMAAGVADSLGMDVMERIGRM